MGFEAEGQDAVQGWQGLGILQGKKGHEVQEAVGRQFGPRIHSPLKPQPNF